MIPNKPATNLTQQSRSSFPQAPCTAWRTPHSSTRFVQHARSASKPPRASNTVVASTAAAQKLHPTPAHRKCGMTSSSWTSRCHRVSSLSCSGSYNSCRNCNVLSRVAASSVRVGQCGGPATSASSSSSLLAMRTLPCNNSSAKWMKVSSSRHGKGSSSRSRRHSGARDGAGTSGRESSADSSTRSSTLTRTVADATSSSSEEEGGGSRASVVISSEGRDRSGIAKRGSSDISDRSKAVQQGASSAEAVVSELLLIAVPVLVALAADPLAGLVGTAFIGRLGVVEIAAAGVALSVFNTTTKLVNVPLLSVTTSTVATAKGKAAQDEASVISTAVSSAVLLGVIAGAVQAMALEVGGSFALDLWGAGVGTELHAQALNYLHVRALGAPVTLVMLVLQGAFRGLQDTRTPLYATLLANVLNVAAAPLLIFGLNQGVAGAAWATVVGEFVPCALLLNKTATDYSLQLGNLAALKDAVRLLGPTGFLMFRTVAIMGTYAVATSLAARAGADAAAAHNICFQLWLACSLLADSLAVAAQTLIARSIAAEDKDYAVQVVNKSVTLALALGTALAVGLYFGQDTLCRAFTTSPTVLANVKTLFPFVVATQPLNALAFVWDGVLYGAGGFRYASMAMVVSAVPAVGLMFVGRAFAEQPVDQLVWVWAGLSLVMLLRTASIYVPYKLQMGPFTRMLETKQN